MTSAPRPMPSSPFGDDDGMADPRVREALEAFAGGEGGSADVLAALAVSRLLVPVVAAPDEAPADPDLAEPGDSGADHHADMATVLTTGKDGRRGLLAFTSIDTLRTWNPEARPSPVPTRTAAEAALADGADALVIDLAGPVVFSVDARDLRSLASGWRPLGTWNGVGTADPGGAPLPAATPADSSPAKLRAVRRVGGRAWHKVRRTLMR